MRASRDLKNTRGLGGSRGLLMIAGSRSHWKRPLSWFVCCMVTTPFGVLTADGQQAATSQPADQLQQQLQQLKQQYDTTTRDLEQRISALEQQIEKQKENEKEEKEAREKSKQGIISAAELAAQGAAKKAVLGESDQVGAKFQ